MRVLVFLLSLVLLFALPAAEHSAFAGEDDGGWETWEDVDNGPEPDDEGDDGGGGAPAGNVLSALTDDAPGMALEREAERLLRRGERLSAQYGYADAFNACVEAASASEAPDEADLLWARAEFNLERARALYDETLEGESLLEAVEAARAVENIDPLLRARVDWVRARLERRRGEAERAAGIADELGLLREWLIVGPFDNERGRGFGRTRGPEAWPYDPEAEFEALKGPARWRPVRSRHPLGFLDLDAFLRPNDECLAFALAAVRVEEGVDAALRLGSSDMIAVRVNGAPVHRFAGQRRAAFDQAAVPVRLRKGWNLILLEVGDAKGEWGAYVRLTTPAGAPLAVARATADPKQIAAAVADLPAPGSDAPPPPDPEEAIDATDDEAGDAAEEGGGPAHADAPDAAEGGVRKGALETFEKALAFDPYNARVNYYLGWLLQQRQTLGRADRRDMELLDQAARSSDRDPVYDLAFAAAATDHAAHEADRDENPRRLALEKAVKEGDDEVEARVRLAEYYLRSMRNYRRARELASRAARANRLALSPKLTLFDTRKALGWDPMAMALLERIRRQHPDARPVLRRAVSEALARNANGEAAEHARRLSALDLTDPAGQDGLAEALLRLGKDEALIDAVKGFLRVTPYRPALHRALIEAYLRVRNLPAARAAAAEALRIAPEDAEILALEGRVLERMDRRDEAVRVWRRALELRPALAGVRRRLDHLLDREETLVTRIPDLRAFVAGHKDRTARRGDSRQYLLFESAHRLHADGTVSRLVHHVVKVLDDEAVRELASSGVSYERDRETLTLFTARVLRADGAVDAAKVTDFDAPGYPARKHISFAPLEKGDVIEVSYRIDESKKGFFGDYFGDVFFFRRSYPTAVARYILSAAPGREVHLHQLNGAPAPEVATDPATGEVRRTWVMRDQPAIEIESFMPPLRELSPLVQVSTFATWDDLAVWYWHLIKDQFNSTPALERHTERLAAGEASALAKLEAIYRWVVNNVQNVAWEFGVHGYKNYKVSTVFQRRFGDCKDKAGLIQVMARAIGLEAWPVLLRATEEGGDRVGRGREDLTLPLLGHFNHAIAGVELDGRMHFLDGTTQQWTLTGVPAMDAGAHAVVVRPDGAELVRIPEAEAGDHAWRSEGRLRLRPDGRATLNQQITATGEAAAFLRFYFGRPGRGARVLNVLAARRYGALEVDACDFREEGGVLDRTVALDTRLTLRNYVRRTETGFRFRLPAGWLRGEPGSLPFPARMAVFAESSVRAHDVLLHNPFLLSMQLRIEPPEGYAIVNVPDPVELKHPFGELTARFRPESGAIIVERTLRMARTRIPRDDYAVFRRFCHRADEVDGYEFVVEKETP